MRVVDLRQKEVINICTCKTLGCPIDVEFNPKTGHLTGLVLPGPVKFCGFFCHGEDFVIPWDRICQIGNDIILVEIPEKEKKPCTSISTVSSQQFLTQPVSPSW